MSRARHVRREHLPWREPQTIAECGRPIGSRSISRADFEELRADAIQRHIAARNPEDRAVFDATRLDVCMRCYESSRKFLDWRTDPTAVMVRFLQAGDTWHCGPEWVDMAADLHALAELAELHDGQLQRLRERHRQALTVRFSNRARRSVLI